MKKLILLFTIAASIAQAQTTKLTSGTFGLMEARNIGPAVMGGRITAIDAINDDARTIYVGTAAGGIWKSTTGGASFKPIFDKYTQSIGAITISQKNPKTIYVGTGESNMRNSVSYGTGMYKSTDGGDNWVNIGLDSSEHISKIVIDPTNDSIVYVAVPGALWSDSQHRGLYKTTDGGATWKKILYTDVKTGCADVLVDPVNPQIVYASMWQFRRTGWSFSSGGPGSALYKSKDGGATWKKIQKGFDGEELGRICLALAPSKPDNVYAIAESKKTALYLSNDGGENWTKTSTNENVGARPFYFSTIMVDPIDTNRVYRPAFTLSFSDDGGKTFSQATGLGGWVHSDHHALWINPKNTNQLFLGTDGGLYTSLDRGVSFTIINTLPVSQYYHVTFDEAQPYNVYGGLQDNDSWVGPSQSIGGVKNADWKDVGQGGDGFWVQPDLSDPNFVFTEIQGGRSIRYNRATNEKKDIQPYALAGEPKLRWNWNSPLQSSPTNKNVLYAGAQYIYKSTNKGDKWERISPDLTTNDPSKQKQEESGGVTVDNSSAENHCTIYTISESPLDQNQLWAGTDDGNLQLTTDGGKNWTNLVKNIQGLPANTWCSSITPSKFDKNTVYVSFENHTRGDFKPYLFKSTDLGKTWVSISTAEIKSFVHQITEDLVNPKLLFAGTEMGLYISLDGGTSWIQFTTKVPATPVRDIKVNPVTSDLVLATHGRGVMILDDITPIRALTEQVVNQDAALLPSRPNYLSMGQFNGVFPSSGGYVGNNATEDAVIYYYLKDRATSGEVKVEIYGADGKIIQTVQGSKRKGINRVTWNMRGTPPKVARGVKPDFAGFVGPLVQEGTYTVRLIKGDKTYDGKLELVPLPWSTHTKADREMAYKTTQTLFNMCEELYNMTNEVTSMRDSAKNLKSGNTISKNIDKALADFISKCEKERAVLVAVKEGTGITGEEKIRERLSGLYTGVASFEGRPTDSQLDRLKAIRKEMDDEKKAIDNLANVDLVNLNKQLVKAKISPIVIVK